MQYTRKHLQLDSMLRDKLAQESSGKSPRLFSSRKTLFGIPSSLDQELEALSDAASEEHARSNGLGKGAKRSKVFHNIEPVFNDGSKVLILGTMPSPVSRDVGFYYSHPQNRFWKVMASLFDESVAVDVDEKRSQMLRHGIALWDVLASCEIEGAKDGSIAECVPNDLDSVLSKCGIRQIFCTGKKAAELYDLYCFPHTEMECIGLPSTSSANAAMSLEQLIEAYSVILDYL